MTDQMVQHKDESGNWVDWMTVEEHIAAFPGFINNINLGDAVPVDLRTFGAVNEDGDVFISNGAEVEIVEADSDILILCHDDYGQEWFEKK